MKTIPPALTLLLALASGLQADGARTSAALFLQDLPSPKAVALGGAWTALPGETSTLFLNPAGLSAAAHSGALAVHSALPADSRIQSAGALLRFPKLKGAAAISATIFQAGEFETRDIQGNQLGTDRAGGQSWSVAWGTAWGRERLGLRVKNVQENLGSDRGSATAFDAGVQAPWGENAAWGAAVENFGSKLAVGSVGYDLPRTMRTGVIYRPSLGGRRSLVTMDAVKPVNGSLSWRAGTEAALGSSFVMRAGYDFSPGSRSGAAVGLGFSTSGGAPSASQWGVFHFDYSYSFKQDVEAAHQLSVGVEFQ